MYLYPRPNECVF